MRAAGGPTRRVVRALAVAALTSLFTLVVLAAGALAQTEPYSGSNGGGGHGTTTYSGTSGGTGSLAFTGKDLLVVAVAGLLALVLGTVIVRRLRVQDR